MVELLMIVLTLGGTAQNARDINRFCRPEIRKEMALILSAESSYNPKATNKSGDYGLGQVNWRVWHKELKIRSKKALLNPTYNINISCQILERYYKSGAQDWYLHYHSKTPSREKIYAELLSKRAKRVYVAFSKYVREFDKYGFVLVGGKAEHFATMFMGIQSTFAKCQVTVPAVVLVLGPGYYDGAVFFDGSYEHLVRQLVSESAIFNAGQAGCLLKGLKS